MNRQLPRPHSTLTVNQRLQKRGKSCTSLLGLMCWSLSLIPLVTTVPVMGQEVHYLALEQEGTASISVDRETALALVTDGGRRGQGGILGARIDDRTILSYLKANQVRRLVITCSHPHRDHAGGLEDLVRDSEILDFDEITFVDNEYANVTGKRGLFDIFRQTAGRDADGLKARYLSARNRNALAEISVTAESVRPGNYVYDPAILGEGTHDQAVISYYDVLDGQQQRRVVDFDDASGRLIRHWADSQPTQIANVLVVPHHGSSRNDLSSVLDNAGRHGLEDAILTVNRDNRYSHPAPRVLRSLVEKLGPEHVYVTDSEIGENITIAPDGVAYSNGTEPRVRLASFIQAQTQRYEAEYRALLQKASVAAGDRIEVTTGTAEQLADRLLRARRLDPREAAKFTRLVRALDDLGYTRDLVEGTNYHRRNLLARMAGSIGPVGSRLDSEMALTHTPEMGIERWRDMLEGRLDTQGGTGVGYRNARATRFGNLAQSAIPRWGGIVLGNAVHYDGPEPRSLDFVETVPVFDGLGSSGTMTLRLSLEDGSTVDYVGVTTDELWSAYNFVQPTEAYQAAHGETLPRGAAGLVGISGRRAEGSIWTFAVHPAIAGTALARDAMRVDMLISGATRNRESSSLEGIPWDNLDFFTYQWNDAQAEISTENGRLLVSPAEGAESCMLRVRLVSWEPPEWLDVGRREASIILEVAERLTERGLAADEKNLSAVFEELEGELTESAESSFWLNRHMAEICSRFDAARTVDRLARVISVLNWFVEVSGEVLPPLPSSFTRAVPVVAVPSAWAFSDVLFGDVEMEIVR